MSDELTYWQVIVHVEDGGTVTHSFAYENDARFHFSEWRGQGINCDIKEVTV